jgi:hypothetical protein
MGVSWTDPLWWWAAPKDRYAPGNNSAYHPRPVGEDRTGGEAANPPAVPPPTPPSGQPSPGHHVQPGIQQSKNTGPHNPHRRGGAHASTPRRPPQHRRAG